MPDTQDDIRKFLVSNTANESTTLVNALTAEILTRDCAKFLVWEDLVDYVTLLLKTKSNYSDDQEVGGLNKQGKSNYTNFILIDDSGVQLNSTNYKNTNCKHIYLYFQQMFNATTEDSINDNLNFRLDPLPNLIKPVKPLNNSNVSLSGWLLALEDDVDIYYTNVILHFKNTHHNYFDVLANIMHYVDTFYEQNIRYDPKQININEMFAFDYNKVVLNLKQIEISSNSFLIDLLDLNKFDNFYSKFKDLRVKIERFVSTIVNEEFEKLDASYQTLQNTQSNLMQSIKTLLSTSLEFDIDTLMFEKFKVISEKLSKEKCYMNDINNFTGQVNTLYTIANSLFAKSNEILIVKRNIQSSLIKFISTDITNHQIKIMNFKNLVNKDLNENLGLLTVQYDSLMYAQIKLPLMYGLNLLEIYRRKVFFKLKYLLKFHNLVIKNNSWLENDIEAEISTRKEYLSTFESLRDIKFLNFKLLNQRFHINNTFADIKYLKKNLNLGEEEDDDEDDQLGQKFDKESSDIIRYCEKLANSELDEISTVIMQKFEEMKKDILNQSQILIANSQDNNEHNNLILSLETKVDTLKSKLILQDLFDIDEWPISFSQSQSQSPSPTVSKSNENSEPTVSYLIAELEKQKLENQRMKSMLEDQVLKFKQDFNTNSNINQNLLETIETLKRENSSITDNNKTLYQRLKANLYKDIALLEKIGLLFDIKEMKVNRVKGLKKPNSSMLDSTILLPLDSDLTESVVVKADVSMLTDISKEEQLLKFDTNFKQTYIKSVEKRFVDLEELAKTLNRENKKMKKQLKNENKLENAEAKQVANI